MRARSLGVLAVLASGAVLGACTTTVGGTAQPLENPPTTSQNRAAAGEPCALLTPEEAAALGLSERGEFRPGEPSRLVPPACTWTRADPDSDLDSLDAGFETSFSLAEYVDGAEPVKTAEFGGLTWAYFADPITGGSVCTLATEVSDTSFVALTTSNFDDESKACEVAEQAAPYVSSHLPGGEPAPEPTTSSAPPPSPLASVDPCTLLTPQQAGQLRLSRSPEPLDGLPEYDQPGGCQWQDTDGDAGGKALDLYAGDYPAEEWPLTDGPSEDVRAGERTWKLFDDPDDTGVTCQATLRYSENASVLLRSGHLDDPAKACATVRAAIPMVTGNLP
ncbi:DUF3558 family protein [Prauserella muralis]|uniref:Uncharacterized protein n=1 Tax=Prauserella muralis TaxID=588067 RepID=A0A2V4B9U7_9PSEU|nr:DUF3558 family protein [Prauserella muralis]PXY31831.1 hypothetical protein BAY60_05720 [Prauserella muralis]TWE13758.1 uncharacterized protein DUF3558 [Prauserella muralis]